MLEGKGIFGEEKKYFFFSPKIGTIFFSRLTEDFVRDLRTRTSFSHAKSVAGAPHAHAPGQGPSGRQRPQD